MVPLNNSLTKGEEIYSSQEDVAHGKERDYSLAMHFRNLVH